MANIFQYLPQLEPDEMAFVQGLVRDLTDQQLQQFAVIYGARRKDPQLILITTLAGFVGFAGIQRFILGNIGMGLLYFFTGGFCLIGTIIDLVNHKRLAFEANAQAAQQALMMAKSFN
jgi:TM2 domain-containing membrane protein YozV